MFIKMHNDYVTPEVEILEVTFEAGFENSSLEDIEDERQPIEW